MSDLCCYGIVDCAMDRRIIQIVRHCSQFQSLYGGELEEPLASAAPYIVEIKPGEPLQGAWQGNWANNWGILVYTKKSFKYARLHFKSFLTAELPDKSLAMFRFYDPRVFNSFYRASTSEQYQAMLKGIDSIVTHCDTSPNAVCTYRQEGLVS